MIMSAHAAILDPKEPFGKGLKQSHYPVSVAPMMGYSNRHGRYLWRLLSSQALLYTEMIVARALLRGAPARLLQYNPEEHPLALQLAGSETRELAAAASLGESYGFCEINLNAGCPSARVQQAGIGAILMRDIAKLAELAAAMRDAVNVPVSVKCRIAVDEQDSEATLNDLAQRLQAAGVYKLIVHARRGILRGLSPKANRKVPSLDYQRVYRLKQDYPRMQVVLNGGLGDWQAIAAALDKVDGVMIGRAACNNPWLVAELEQHLSGTTLPERATIVEAMLAYSRLRRNSQGVTRSELLKLTANLFRDEVGAKSKRRALLTTA